MPAGMRLRNNLWANLVGTGVSSAVALLSAPLIFRSLGADAYGLVGIYLLLQGLMPLFDLGITPGLARAVAWHRGTGGGGQVLTLVRLAQRPMLILALIFLFGLVGLSGFISGHWLSSALLPTSTIQFALVLMGAALALRMVAGLQKAALMAIEHQIEANLVQSLAVVARTLGALGFALFTGTGVFGFFVVQAPISLLEWGAYRRCLRQSLTQAPEAVPQAELRQHVRFGLGVAGLAVIWLMASQVDKLALSRILPLSEFGGYSLGAHIASAIVIATGPIQAAVLPRLTRLIAGGEESEARLLYGMATAMTVALTAGLVVGIWLAGAAVIALIRPAAAIEVQPMQIALAYAFGNGAIAIVGLAYQLQNARGRLRLHAMGAIAQAAVQVPVLIWVAATAGALPTAIVFAALNWLFLASWIPLVHARFLRGGNLPWLRRDLLPPMATAGIVGGALVVALPQSHSLLLQGMLALCGMGLTALAALLSHNDIRAYVAQHWRHANDG